MGARREPTDQQLLAPLMARARNELGEDAFTAARDAGRALSYEGALAEARAWLESEHP